MLEEMHRLRDVARVHGSLARVLDGHYNAIERLTLARVLGESEIRAVVSGELLFGVWGADPVGEEGEPAQLESGVLHGVKTFCSGAGVVDRALVVASEQSGARRLVYLDAAQSAVRVDRSWYAGPGLRASESHRVQFDGAEVIAVLGKRDELLREPYFSRDAARSSATWVGVCESVVERSVDLLSARAPVGDLNALAAARMQVAARTAGLWLERAGARADAGELSAATALEARWAITGACREVMRQAAESCGSRPLATRTDLGRARRDLDLLLLQHRLTPALARYGHEALRGGE
ncbi:MAG: acyl-CoA dehydrogenase family protein, partial [Solirubrobacteraceae bacterium]